MEAEKDTIAWHSLRDEVISFSPIRRRYAPRGIEREQYVSLSDSSHDPMSEL